MRVLVTGVAGFIGYHVCKNLLERGDEVVGVDNLNSYYSVDLKVDRLQQLGCDVDPNQVKVELASEKYDNFIFIKADIVDSAIMDNIFKQRQFDAVCHLAAQAGVRYSIDNPQVYIESNILGFLNILEGCRQYQVKNLCFASSSSVYGLNQSQPFKTSDHTDHPISLYAATKKSNEMMAHAYAHLYGISCTGLRFFTVYGPWGRPDMAPMLFATAIHNEKPINIFNYGNMSRDFTYIDDIVSGIVGIIDNPASSDITFNPQNPNPNHSSAPFKLYNIGNNSPVQLMRFIKILEQEMGKSAIKNMMDMQAGDVASTFADSSELHQDLGFSPQTSLEKGINKFVHWFKSYNK